jgi:hypothetical protein
MGFPRGQAAGLGGGRSDDFPQIRRGVGYTWGGESENGTNHQTNAELTRLKPGQKSTGMRIVGELYEQSDCPKSKLTRTPLFWASAGDP